MTLGKQQVGFGSVRGMIVGNSNVGEMEHVSDVGDDWLLVWHIRESCEGPNNWNVQAPFLGSNLVACGLLRSSMRVLLFQQTCERYSNSVRLPDGRIVYRPKLVRQFL